jgi:glycosyltransferase involved in cell wall biosynthesis
LFTIITSTLNCREALKSTATSIASQNCKDIQWIIIDGCSTDGTKEFIHELGSLVSYSVSEPDSGIYDAWNKACKHISNKWVIFLGAGDIFAQTDVLSRVHSFVENLDNTISYVYGDVLADNKKTKLSSGHIQFREWDLYRPKLPYHQGVFHNSIHLKRENLFDCSYKIISDSKLLLQLNLLASGGISQNVTHAVKAMREFLLLEKEMNYKLPIINKLTYITLTLTKYFIYKIFGGNFLNILINFKNQFFK